MKMIKKLFKKYKNKNKTNLVKNHTILKNKTKIKFQRKMKDIMIIKISLIIEKQHQINLILKPINTIKRKVIKLKVYLLIDLNQ